MGLNFFTNSKKNTVRKRFFRAETLIEVVIALFVVALGATTGTSLIITALQSNSFSRDNLIALNLATEGIEAMRNIRDTNWLRFGFNKPNCWNMRPVIASCNDVNNLIGEGNFTIDLDINTMEWSLSESQSQPLNLANGNSVANEYYRLKYIDLDGGKDQELYISGQIKLYPGSPMAINGDSKFYRMVQVDYPNNDPSTADEMAVTSVVQWQAQGVSHQVVLTTKLTNYLKAEVNQ